MKVQLLLNSSSMLIMKIVNSLMTKLKIKSTLKKKLKTKSKSAEMTSLQIP